MNFKLYLILKLFLFIAFYSSAQTWSGTPNNTFTNANVGIGFATSPTLSEKLVVNGNIKLIGGLLSFSENSIKIASRIYFGSSERNINGKSKNSNCRKC